MRAPLPTPQQALAYEVESSFIASIAGCEWMQKILALYFARKINRKLAKAHAARKRWDEIKERRGIKL